MTMNDLERRLYSEANGRETADLYEKRDTESLEDGSSNDPFLPYETSPLVDLKKRKYGLTLRLFYVVVMVLVLAVSLASLIITIWRATKDGKPVDCTVSNDKILRCGQSAEEARDRGCVFDVMNYAWTPAPCHNSTLSREYWESEDWMFYRDKTLHSVIPNEEVLGGQHEYVYAYWLLHYKHCEYALNRLSLGVKYGLPVDNELRNASHMMHCVHTMQEPKPPNGYKPFFNAFAYLSCSSKVGDIGAIGWNQPPGAPLELDDESSLDIGFRGTAWGIGA